MTVDLSGALQPLEPGALYSYNLQFEVAGGARSDLLSEGLLTGESAGQRIKDVNPGAPLHKALGFTDNDLPTFLAPPATFTSLRIAHCSCRRPGAGSFDALAGLAPLIRATDPDQRPHQLFLTGDQIYADDVAAPYLPLVCEVGESLLGTQPLPGFPPDPRAKPPVGGGVTGAGLPGNVANLPPLRRKWLLWQLANLTGSDVENHSITFPEFVAQHLLAWSPRVWRSIPDFTAVFKVGAPAVAIAPWLNRPWVCLEDPEHPEPEPALKARWANPGKDSDTVGDFNASANHLARYAAGTASVAQVLANTPTYMQFDDHEIADDWNLNGRWAVEVYNSEWGRYVIRNGLLAYTLMQAWGNQPAEFLAGKPGKALLDGIPAAVSATTPAARATVDILLGFDKPTPAVKKRVAFNYAVEAGDYRETVLDTRTHRAINDLSLESPNLIDNLDEQLPQRPAAATQKILVVVSPVPVFGPVVMEQLGQPVAQRIQDALARHKIGDVPGFPDGDTPNKARNAGCGGRGARGAETYDREGWSANDAGFEALLARLASWESVVVLSGDVHYAGTLSLDYWTKGATTGARIVQCISSPAKNVFKEVVDQILRHVGNLQRAEEIPAERLAWKKIGAGDLVPAGKRIPLARRSALRREPALLPSGPWPAGSTIPAGKPPDWRWRMLPIADDTTILTGDLQAEQFAPGVESRPDAIRMTEITRVHQERLKDNLPPLRRLVFSPNFGLLTFRAAASAVEVVHTLYSPKLPSLAPERTALKGGPIKKDNAQFGPHTVHVAALRTPATQTPPTLEADPS